MSKGLFLLLLLSVLLWCCEKYLWKNTFTYALSHYLLQRNVWPSSVFISSYESTTVCAVIVFMMDPIHEMECGISATYSQMSHSFIIVPFLLKRGHFWSQMAPVWGDFMAAVCESPLSCVVFVSAQNQFLFSTLWVLGLEYGLSGLPQGTSLTEVSQWQRKSHANFIHTICHPPTLSFRIIHKFVMYGVLLCLEAVVE